MFTLSQLTELLGWASLLNIVFLLLITILLLTMKPVITAMHSKLFGISESDLSLIYFNYLAHYKLLTFVFILIPYISLKITGL